MATYYKIDGLALEVTPKDGKKFSYPELQAFVGSRIEIVPLPDKRVVVLHEEGKLIGLPPNENACKEWQKAYPIEKYPHNNDGLIVGDALFTEEKYIR